MNRLAALLIAAFALLPATALAAPSPSPVLSSILAPPPKTDYKEASTTNTTLLEGQFDAKTFVTKTGASNPDAVLQTLNREGFVDGYWRTWVQSGTQHVLIEVAIAFGGGAGAKRWLGAAELAAKGEASYTKSLSTTGIDSYFGAHYLYPVNHSVGEEFAFVKGNDYFDLVFVSPKDDLGTSAPTQATSQYTFAPDATIPKSKWPETTTSSTAFQAGFAVGRILFFVLIAAVIVAVIGIVIWLRRRPRLVGAVPGAMPGVMAGAMPVAAAAPTPQMSPDGAFWWDGQTWRDAQHEVPPAAQRSADGAFWWDGQKWRPVS
jgi:hypothetical protein